MIRCYLCNRVIVHPGDSVPSRRIACHSCGKDLIGDTTEDRYVFFYKPLESNGYLAIDFVAPFVVEDQRYNCVEQFIQSKKAEYFNDDKMRTEILSVDDPKTQQDLGRKIKNFSPLKWQSSSEDGIPYRSKVMFDGNVAKFSLREDLRRRLLSTNNRKIVFASPYDRTWGVGLGIREQGLRNENIWVGENLLGKILMNVRSILQRVDNEKCFTKQKSLL